jgi:hypothetical protein
MSGIALAKTEAKAKPGNSERSTPISFCTFEFRSFEFVSDLELRISDFSTALLLLTVLLLKTSRTYKAVTNDYFELGLLAPKTVPRCGIDMRTEMSSSFRPWALCVYLLANIPIF